MVRRRLTMATRSIRERRQHQRHDHRWYGVLSEVPSAGVSLPIAGVTESCRQWPSVGPWPGTRAQCCYDKSNKTRLRKSLNSIHITNNTVSKFFSQTVYNLSFIITRVNICKVIDAFLYSSECTQTSMTDETTSFLQPLRLCKKQSFFL